MSHSAPAVEAGHNWNLSDRQRLEILLAILLALFQNVPEAFRSQVEPIIPQIVQAIDEAFAAAIASTFWISIAAAAIAAVSVLFLRESEIRGTAVAGGAAHPDA